MEGQATLFSLFFLFFFEHSHYALTHGLFWRSRLPVAAYASRYNCENFFPA